MGYLAPNWVRAVENAVPYFERLGFVMVGQLKQGRTLRMQILVRGSLISLAGRLRERLAE